MYTTYTHKHSRKPSTEHTSSQWHAKVFFLYIYIYTHLKKREDKLREICHSPIHSPNRHSSIITPLKCLWSFWAKCKAFFSTVDVYVQYTKSAEYVDFILSFRRIFGLYPNYWKKYFQNYWKIYFQFHLQYWWRHGV